MSATAYAPPLPRVGLSSHLDGRRNSGLLLADGTSTHDDGLSVSIGNEASADGNLSATTRQFTPGAVRVLLSKLALMGLLLITALIVAFSVYINESSNEEANFKTQFETSARQIVHMVNKNVHTMYMSVESMSVLFPSAAHHSGEVLPFVTVPDFEAAGQSARMLSKPSMIVFAPLLRTHNELLLWNHYSANHTSWVDEGRLLNTTIATLQQERMADVGIQHAATNGGSTLSTSNNITKFVYMGDEAGRILPESGDGFYAPVWETSPVPNDTSGVNFNLASIPLYADLLTYTNLTSLPILSEPIQLHNLIQKAPVEGQFDSPKSILLQPVFDGFEVGKAHRAVGVLMAVISWVDFFTDVLPDGQRDMVVVADSCGHNNTYLIHEKYAEFVGSGDLHDRQYSSMEKRAVFVEFNPSTEIEHCRHALHIFASDALRREYVTRKPILYATFIVVLFFLTGVMFLVYDSLVARRQRQTEQTAQRATTIVKGLFPKEVAAQLYGSEDGAKCAENEDDTKMLCGEAVDSAGSDAVNTTIARLYPSATVLFAPSVYSLGDHFPGF